ncbi:Vacuolar protein sorting-associated protein 62 [Sesbania bispinosa]|nr:Vacuolar protein sorting-associated protein 62 [Sesbania bispinosa]
MASSLSYSKKAKRPPIEITFKLPADIPIWPPGDGFATGIIDLGGGLLVSQISTFNKVWTTYEGGPDDLGATFLEPKGLPEGFFMLGCYCQPNNKPLHGWVLVGKDDSSTSTTDGALKKPVYYKLVCNCKSLKIKQDGQGYIWLPIAPDGYKALGHVVTTSLEKPSLDRIRCARSDLTDESQGVPVGTFLAQSGGTNSKPLPIVCLKNTKASLSSMPNLPQIESLIKTYSPYMYMHPMEEYPPSSVDWLFTNGAVLYEKRKGVIKVNSIEPTGSSLPQGDTNDDDVTYWLDLPVDEAKRNRVKKGDLQSSQAYVHVKPMLGGTFTNIVMWVFYPFNGGARAKVACTNIPLRTKDEHVGDWEHVTLRVSNFNGELWKVYFSQHNKGLGIRNDAAKSDMVMDMEKGFQIVAAEYLGSEIREPPWINYRMNWGSKDGPKGPKQKDYWRGDEP